MWSGTDVLTFQRNLLPPILFVENSGRQFLQNLTLSTRYSGITSQKTATQCTFLVSSTLKKLKNMKKICFITIHELYYLAKKCSLSYITNHSSFYNTEINRTSMVLDNTICLTSSTRLSR